MARAHWLGADDDLEAAEGELTAAREAMPDDQPPALEALAAIFDLSPFERDLLLVAAGVELDAGFADAAAPVTFGRALAALSDAHWSALAPGSALRRWRLLSVGSGSSLAESPLRVDERVLHYLTGVQYLDERLAGHLESVMADGPAPELVLSHRELAAELAGVWATATSPGGELPILHLLGADPGTRRAIAAHAAGALGLRLYTLSAPLLPAAPDELDGLARLWERESALSRAALLVEMDDTASTAEGDPVREAALGRLLDSIRDRSSSPAAAADRLAIAPWPPSTWSRRPPTSSGSCGPTPWGTPRPR